MTQFFFDDFETDDFSNWDSATAGSYMFTSAASALAGSYGCEFAAGCFGCVDRATLLLNAFSTLAGAFRVGFLFDQNDISLSSNQYIEMLSVTPLTLSDIFIIRVINDAGTLKIQAIGVDDSNVEYTAEYTLSAGVKDFEARVVSATTAVSSDGSVSIYIDGSLVDSVSGIDNHTKFQDIGGGNLKIEPEQNTGDASSGSYYIDNFELRDDDTPIFTGATGVYVLGFDIDKENDGQYGWLTLWRSSNLYLQKWDLDAMTGTFEIGLGAATWSQVESREKIAFPYVASDDQLWIYGNMDAPAFLTGTHQLIETSTGGASGTWASFNLSWGSDVLGALFVSGDTTGSDDRLFYGVRNKAASKPDFYYGLNALNLQSTIPVSDGTKVKHGSLAVSQRGEIALGLDTYAGTGISVIASIDDGSSWVDVTYNLPSGTTSEVLRYL